MALKTNQPVCIIILFLLLPNAIHSQFFTNNQQRDEDDFDMVYMPQLAQPLASIEEIESIPYQFQAFGSDIALKLKRNDGLITPFMRTVIRNGWRAQDMENPPNNCHYLHRDSDTAAAFSFCDANTVQGLLFLPNATLEVHPLPGPATLTNWGRRSPHIVKRVPPFPHDFKDDFIPSPFTNHRRFGPFKRAEAKLSTGPLTIEVALFVDEAAYRTFSPYFQQRDEQMRNMLLAYMNGIQALYHHPSLGRKFNLALVRLELLKKQPANLPHHDGERGLLLDSFCQYAQNLNPPGDDNPQHWDIGLYVTGLDMFAMEGGRRSGVTMGLATLGGACTNQYNCVVAEMGTTNVFGKPYVSAGFNSVYIMAHEIGHNVGMRHDSLDDGCPKDGYIMSPSRGSRGETTWSKCSARAVQTMDWAPCLQDKPQKIAPELDHTTLHDAPGQRYGAKMQCQFFLKDGDAEVNAVGRLEDICQDLSCRTPHRSGYYFAGPALTGTPCGPNKWCEGGACVTGRAIDNIRKGGWSPWQSSSCRSGCLTKAKGFQSRSRTCTNPKPINTDEGCEGPSYDVLLCDDKKMCPARSSTVAYATKKCKEFSRLVAELDPKAAGLQAPHEQERLWMGCAIFCRRKGTGSYYTPRLDLNDLGVDPYFPDGTWCHNDGSSNFYCLQHHCLPENFIFVKEVVNTDDFNVVQNAPPRTNPLPDDLRKYLSVDALGHPLLKTLTNITEFDEDWTDNDYVEFPHAPRV